MARAYRIASLPEPHFWELTPAEVEGIIQEAIEERILFDSWPDQRNAVLCSLLANCHRDPKKQAYSPEDFLLRRMPKAEPRPAETAHKVTTAMAAVGKINRALNNG